MKKSKLSGEQFLDILYKKGAIALISFSTGAYIFIHGSIYIGKYFFYIIRYISSLCGARNAFEALITLLEPTYVFISHFHGILFIFPCIIVYFYLVKYLYHIFNPTNVPKQHEQ